MPVRLTRKLRDRQTFEKFGRALSQAYQASTGAIAGAVRPMITFHFFPRTARQRLGRFAGCAVSATPCTPARCDPRRTWSHASRLRLLMPSVSSICLAAISTPRRDETPCPAQDRGFAAARPHPIFVSSSLRAGGGTWPSGVQPPSAGLNTSCTPAPTQSSRLSSVADLQLRPRATLPFFRSSVCSFLLRPTTKIWLPFDDRRGMTGIDLS